MTREEFKSFLVRSVLDRIISEEEAKALLRRFDAGEIEDESLPLPLSEAVETDEPVMIVAALSALAIGSAIGRAKDAMRNKAQEAFERRARESAAELAKSSAVRAWHARSKALIAEHLYRQMRIGAGRALNVREAAGLSALLQTQNAYLSRFADETGARLLLERALSEGAIAHRLAQYGGFARAEGYRAEEVTRDEEGTVYDYVSVDDAGTCDACLSAESAGPYLAGEGPMPGEVCDGRGFCRCFREARFAPNEVRELRRVAA